jgi:hypothetical protein
MWTAQHSRVQEGGVMDGPDGDELLGPCHLRRGDRWLRTIGQLQLKRQPRFRQVRTEKYSICKFLSHSVPWLRVPMTKLIRFTLVK